MSQDAEIYQAFGRDDRERALMLGGRKGPTARRRSCQTAATVHGSLVRRWKEDESRKRRRGRACLNNKKHGVPVQLRRRDADFFVSSCLWCRWRKQKMVALGWIKEEEEGKQACSLKCKPRRQAPWPD